MKFLTSRYVYAFLLGALLVFGFSPFNFWPFGLVIPALLFLLFEQKKPKQAFGVGFCFGLGEFGVGTSWTYISLAHYGNGILLALVVTLGFILLLALFPALQCWILQRYFVKHSRLVRLLVAYPLLWVGFELLRGWIFTGFPWLLVGYTQTFMPLAGFAKLGSVFLVSWVTIFMAGLILALGKEWKTEWTRQIVCLALILLLFIAGGILRQYQFTKPLGQPLHVALVQGNIPEEEKWDPKDLGKILSTYADLTGPVLNTSLIVWPENAIPNLPQNVINFIGALDNNASIFKSAIVFGIPIEDTINQKFFNGALAVGDANGMYLKQHLVPFGEYTPLPSILDPVFKTFNIPMSVFSEGPPNPIPMTIHGLPVHIFICYESAYPFLFREAKDSAYIITLTDDAWFGHSLGAYQHEEMEAMRAIETGRPILRATNTGVTSIIDQNGRILAKAPMFQQYVLKGQIQPVSGETPWLRI